MIITHKKQPIAIISNIEELEKYITDNTLIINFKKFQDNTRNTLLENISNTSRIGIKELKTKWLKKYCNCKSVWVDQYWIERGYSKQETLENIKLFQRNNSKKSVQKSKTERNENPDYYKSKRSIYKEFWISKGYSEEEAMSLLTKRQNTVSLESLVIKYGKAQGEQKYKERNSKWITSLYNKPIEEINKFNKSKCVTKEKMCLKYGDIVGTQKWLNYIHAHSNMWKGSKIANSYIQEIINIISIPDDDLFYAAKKEFYIYDKKIKKLFFYDFTIISKKIIIEFNGQHVHPNPDIHDKNIWKQAFSKKSYEECIQYDNYKKQLAEKSGFNVLTIWIDKNESKPQIEKLQECINFINNN